MTKKQKQPPMEFELKRRLDEQDGNIEILHKTMNQVLDFLKGSEAMDSPGVIKKLKDFGVQLEEFGKKMDYFERWWELQKLKKGTFTFRTANLLTRGSSLVGIIATLAAVVYTILQIIEWLKK